MIKVCESRYGGRTCIYRYINPNHIVYLHRAYTQSETNIEAELTNGEKVIILYKKDLLSLVGPKYFDELMEKQS